MMLPRRHFLGLLASTAVLPGLGLQDEIVGRWSWLHGVAWLDDLSLDESSFDEVEPIQVRDERGYVLVVHPSVVSDMR